MSTLEKVSDIELVRELCRRLGLDKVDNQTDVYDYSYYDGPNEYLTKATHPQDAPQIIYIGNGVGYSNFVACFYFENDKLVGHGVWE